MFCTKAGFTIATVTGLGACPPLFCAPAALFLPASTTKILSNASAITTTKIIKGTRNFFIIEPYCGFCEYVNKKLVREEQIKM